MTRDSTGQVGAKRRRAAGVALTEALITVETVPGEPGIGAAVAASATSPSAAAGQRHAFAYDLTTAALRDLGTLGGPSRRITMDLGLADITARVTVLRRAVIGSTHTTAISATWRGDVTRTDVVRGVVRVVR